MSESSAIADSILDEPESLPVGEEPDTGDWAIMDTLTPRERRFVRRVLLGQELREAAAYAGWNTDDGVIRLLGRPSIRGALKTLAPLAMALDPKRGARLLVPYYAKRLADTAIDGSDAQATTAAKELSSLAGVGTAKVEHIHASLADVLGLLDRRASDERSLPPEPKHLELPAASTDTESDAPVTLDAIWDPVPSSLASKQAKAAPPPAPKSKPPKRGPARRRKTPPPSR
jgi:hypothetical protein